MFTGLGLRVGLPFCSTKITTSPSLTSKECCHIDTHVILGTWDPCEVVSPNFYALNGWDCMYWPQVTWDPVWSGKSRLPCSQRLKLRRLTSSDLGLGALCEVLSPDLHARNGWNCTDWPQLTWHGPTQLVHSFLGGKGLGTQQGTSIWVASSKSDDLGLGTPCEVVSPNFHDLNGWNYTDWPQVTWDMCEPALSALNQNSLHI